MGCGGAEGAQSGVGACREPGLRHAEGCCEMMAVQEGTEKWRSEGVLQGHRPCLGCVSVGLFYSPDIVIENYY